jgi:hypothetical protein
MPNQFKFDPTSIRITEREILADLSYPAVSRTGAKSKPAKDAGSAAKRAHWKRA